MQRSAIRIIGIDPGLRRTGWGVIESDGNRLIFIACGSVETSERAPTAERLKVIHEGLSRVLGDFAPVEAAVEQTFVNKDGAATLKLGQARGIAMLAPAVYGITVAEYAPNQVKKTVLGTLSPHDLANAIALRAKAAVERTRGVGKKVAERIITELKDKAPAIASVDPAVVQLSGAIDDRRAPRPVQDAISALINLGYGQPQAAAAIAAATRAAGDRAETAQLIRLGLKELAK